MATLDDAPTKRIPPNGILHAKKEKKLEYFHEHVGAFVDKYVLNEQVKIMSILASQEFNNVKI